MQDELREQARKADRTDYDRAEIFESLVKHPGWTIYQELLNSKIEQYGSEVLEPAKSIDGAIALEHVKGAMRGLLIARDIASVTIAGKPDIRGRPAAESDDEE